MVVRVNYGGAWPPEIAAEPSIDGSGDRFEVRGVVTHLHASVQLLKADRHGGHLQFNAGAASTRTAAAITVAVDPAASSEAEARALEFLAAANGRATDDASPTLYLGASRLAALAAAALSDEAPLAVGDVVRACLSAAAAPYSSDLEVLARAPRPDAPPPPPPADVDGGGFTARIVAAGASAPPPPPPPPLHGDGAVAGGEWD